jgi:hypothetical protein
MHVSDAASDDKLVLQRERLVALGWRFAFDEEATATLLRT